MFGLGLGLGTQPSAKEMFRKNKRALERSIRDVDRERMRMEQQEKRLIQDIRKMAKQGQMGAVKIMAMDLVRTRNSIKKILLTRSSIQGVALKFQNLMTQHAMTEAMKDATRAMQEMNRQLNLPQFRTILQEFEKQSEIMSVKEEMTDDVMNDMLEGENDDVESDEIVTQVLDELGLQVMERLPGLPSETGALANPVPAQRSPIATPEGVSDIQARLDNLRRM